MKKGSWGPMVSLPMAVGAVAVSLVVLLAAAGANTTPLSPAAGTPSGSGSPGAPPPCPPGQVRMGASCITPGGQGGSSAGSCVYFFWNRTCAVICPANKVLDQGACADACPPARKFIKTAPVYGPPPCGGYRTTQEQARCKEEYRNNPPVVGHDRVCSAMCSKVRSDGVTCDDPDKPVVQPPGQGGSGSGGLASQPGGTPGRAGGSDAGASQAAGSRGSDAGRTR